MIFECNWSEKINNEKKNKKNKNKDRNNNSNINTFGLLSLIIVALKFFCIIELNNEYFEQKLSFQNIG